MPTHTVFYSWQSDLPNSCNRGFIEDCLKDAIKQIQADKELELDPSLDRDTQGASGSADIAPTIFKKIRAADAFVGDVSIINSKRSAECRPTPNPNVLAEMGYSAGLHGWERVICVLNTACGKIDELPFDIRQRLIIAYQLSPAEDKKAVRKALASRLGSTLQHLFTHSQPKIQAHSYISIDCPLTEDEYDLPEIQVHANEYQRIEVRLENPQKNTLDSVDVYFKGLACSICLGNIKPEKRAPLLLWLPLLLAHGQST
jgi:hypothetical protein